MTILFYFWVVLAVVIPILFIWSIWREAHKSNYRWISDTSREMYVDVFKTAISAAGIAVALVASSLRDTSHLVKLSAQVSVVLLIVCIVFSLITMLALARGLEQARSRAAAKGVTNGQGELTDTELRFILVPAAAAFITFLVGFLYLGRITFNI